MNQFYLFSDMNRHIFFTFKKNRYIVLSFILVLFVFFIFKSCGFPYVMEKEYTIGQDSRWRNLNLIGKEKNLAAFNHDLLAAIAKQEQFAVRIAIIPTEELISDLEKGKIQGALSTLNSNYLHANRFIFSNPYFLTGPVLIIPATAPLEGWNEKRKKIVGVSPQLHTVLNLEQDPSIQIKLYDDILKALADLSERRIDGAIFSAIPAYTYVQAFYKNELKISTLPLTDEGIRLVALNNSEGIELIQQFNAGLTQIKDKGIYQEILDRWGFVNIERLLP